MLDKVPSKAASHGCSAINSVILAGLIAGSFLLSAYSASARSDAPLGNRAEAAITIGNNDLLAQSNVSISADDAVAAEAALDGGIFTIVRSGSTAAPLTVEYTVAGTAIDGVDYEALSGSLSIPAGASSGTIAVAPVGDHEIEGSETVIITLNSKATYKLNAPTGATITIADDDTAGQQVSFSISDPSAAEAGAEAGHLTLLRGGSTAMPLVVSYTIGGTATNGEDYIALTGSASIPAGASSFTIELTPRMTQLLRGQEIVVLTLITGPGYTISAPASATIAIADDDQHQQPAPSPSPTPGLNPTPGPSPAPSYWLYVPLVTRAG